MKAGKLYAAAGRVYAAYGGVYVATAIVWLWVVDGIRPTAWDLVGSAVAIVGMSIMYSVLKALVGGRRTADKK